MRPLIEKLIKTAASLKLSLLGMFLLGIGALLIQTGEHPVAWVIAPLLLLSVNLVCAIVSDRRFRAQGALLGFHLCLLVLEGLLVVGYLTRLTGTVELSEGQLFNPEMLDIRREGPWHTWRLRSDLFEQGLVEVDYSPESSRLQTRTQVWLEDRGGERKLVEVKQGTPLLLQGYRFYPTSHQGFSVLLAWESEEGDAPTLGTVHFPSYPRQENNQQNTWQTPAGETLDLGLTLERIPEDKPWVLRSEGMEAELSIAMGDERKLLKPGEQLNVLGGSLRYEELRMWMGYQVYYDPTLPYLFVASLAFVGLMAWRFRQTFWLRSLAEEGA